MQIIEASSFGVRSSVKRFESQSPEPAFLLFPMLHVADPDFYKDISSRLKQCDLILCEGVNSPTGSLITSSYRYFSNSPRLGLVQQRSMDLSHVKDRLIHADVAAREFEGRWHGMRTWWRFGLPLIAPFYGLYMRYFGTRQFLAKGQSMNLKPSRRDVLASDDEREVLGVLLHWRDRHLLRVLEQERVKASNANKVIGVMFGAKHMRAVINHLIKRGNYRQVEADWVTVFDL